MHSANPISPGVREPADGCRQCLDQREPTLPCDPEVRSYCGSASAFVADDQLIPTNDGGRLATRNDIAALEAAGLQPTVLVAHRRPLDEPTLERHREMFERVHFVQQRGVVVSNLTNPRLPTVSAMRIPGNREFRRISDELDRNRRFDLVVASHEYTLVTAKALAQRAGVRVVLRSHNDEAAYLRALARTAKSPKDSVFFGVDALRMASALPRLLADVDCVAVISPDDAMSYRRHGMRTVHVPPVLSDRVRHMSEVPSYADRLPRVVFAGALDIPSTEDGLVWFARFVLPVIRRHHPEADLEVIGRGLEHRLARTLSSLPGVVLTGAVESLEPYMDRARVFVNPVSRGSGVSMKLGSPAAAGLPIVSTRFGIRGLRALDGPVVACDGSEEMAHGVLQLLMDEQRWLAQSRQLLEALRSSYSLAAATETWTQLATVTR